MPGKILNYSCSRFQFLIGTLDITNCITSFGVAQSKFEVGKPLIWSGSMGLATPMPPYNISESSESLDNLDNPGRWAKGRHPVKVFLFGCQVLTLRISSYSYDPDTKEAEAQLTDLLGFCNFDRDPKDSEVATDNSFDIEGNFSQTKATWKQVVTASAVRGSRVKNQEYIRAGQISFPVSDPDKPIPSYSITPQIAANPIQQIAQIAMASGCWVPWIDALENIRFCRWPLSEISPAYELTREDVDEFKRQPPEEDEVTSMAVIGSGVGIVQPESRTLNSGLIAGRLTASA